MPVATDDQRQDEEPCVAKECVAPAADCGGQPGDSIRGESSKNVYPRIGRSGPRVVEINCVVSRIIYLIPLRDIRTLLRKRFGFWSVPQGLCLKKLHMCTCTIADTKDGR